MHKTKFMAQDFQINFRTFRDDNVTGLRTYYRYVVSFDPASPTIPLVNSLTVYDLADNAITVSSDLQTEFEEEAWSIIQKGGEFVFHTLLSSEMSYPSIGNINNPPTSHTGGGIES